MSAPFITYQSPNGWWVVNPEQVYCHNATKAVALATVVATFGPGFESEFDNPADVATFRTVAAAGAHSTIASVKTALSEMDESAAHERLKNLLLLTHSAASELTAEIARENDLAAESIATAKEHTEREAEQQRQIEVKRTAMLKAQEAQRAAIVAAERERLRKSKKLVRWIDGSADFLDVTAKPHRVLRSFKVGETIPEEYLDYA